jgi:hypothetical protein
MNERVDREPVAFGSGGVTLAGYLYRRRASRRGPARAARRSGGLARPAGVACGLSVRCSRQ